jgi:hypothetical protein
VKIYYVTTTREVNKKRRESRIIGFVSVFGWESAEKKAHCKYPTYEITGLHEKPARFRKR